MATSSFTGTRSAVSCSVCSPRTKTDTDSRKQVSGDARDTIYDKPTLKGEFRTIVLHPGRRNDDIKCTLSRDCFRHSRPFYEALSYEWGRPPDPYSPTNMISVNDVPFPVTENAWIALSHLRHRRISRRLWIDAICIWQNNSEERAEQVSMMSLIYSQATRVISWVGTELKDVVQPSMVLLMKLFTTRSEKDRRETEKKIGSLSYPEQLGLLSGRDLQPMVSEDAMKVALHQRDLWQHLSYFLSLPYWKRLWIVQEVVLADNLRIQCGRCFIDGQVLYQFLRYLRSAGELNISGHILGLRFTVAAKVLYYKLDISSPSLRPPFVNTLATFTKHRCKDPRDKIYALLGISAGGGRIQPSYNRTLLQLYEVMITTEQIRRDNQLVLFSQLLQRQLDGLFHLSDPAHVERLNRQGSEILFTRAIKCGTISLLGEAFATREQSRKYLINLYALCFHDIKAHEKPRELPKNVERALSRIANDAARAVAVDSRLSYSYTGIRTSTRPTWEEVALRYDDRQVEPVTAKTDEPRDEGGHWETNSIAVAEGPQSPPDVKYESGNDCRYSDSHGSCECLRTARIQTRPKWMIGTKGQVGLVPGTAKEGDTICHFQNTDVAVVIREYPEKRFHSIIGGAIIIRRWDEEESRLQDAYPDVFDYSTGSLYLTPTSFVEDENQLSVHLDSTCLRLLTCPTKDFKYCPGERQIRAGPKKDHYESFLALSGSLTDSP